MLKIENGVAVQENPEHFEYSYEYWNKYVELEHKPIAVKLNKIRYSLVEEYCDKSGSLLDFGIGSGEFIKKVRLDSVYGYDINPIAVKWLKDRSLFLDPYNDDISNIKAITMWDVLEHVENVELILNKIPKFCLVFLSLPIFGNLESVVQSKHFKPNEHIRYFTYEGVLNYFKEFSFISYNNEENTAGREGIGTFVFKKC